MRDRTLPGGDRPPPPRPVYWLGRYPPAAAPPGPPPGVRGCDSSLTRLISRSVALLCPLPGIVPLRLLDPRPDEYDELPLPPPYDEPPPRGGGRLPPPRDGPPAESESRATRTTLRLNEDMLASSAPPPPLPVPDAAFGGRDRVSAGPPGPGPREGADRMAGPTDWDDGFVKTPPGAPSPRDALAWSTRSDRSDIRPERDIGLC